MEHVLTIERIMAMRDHFSGSIINLYNISGVCLNAVGLEGDEISCIHEDVVAADIRNVLARQTTKMMMTPRLGQR